MNTLNRISVFVCAMILVLTFVQMVPHGSAVLTPQEKTAAFLNDVVGLDMARYSSSGPHYYTSPTETVMYYLGSSEGDLRVECEFWSGKISWFKIYRLNHTLPILAQPANNTLEDVEAFLDRYQSFIQGSYLLPMRKMLNNVTHEMIDDITEYKPLKLLEGELQLQIIKYDNEGNKIGFWWTQCVSGIIIPENDVGLVFDRGIFEMLGDHWDPDAKVGSDIKVSEEEAIRIARERAQNYSYTMGDNTIVSNFKILDEPVFTELTMMNRDGALYPFWQIRLCLAEVYPGLVTEIRVSLWGDTGEITSIQAVGSLGSPSSDGITSLDGTNTAEQTDEALSSPSASQPTASPRSEPQATASISTESSPSAQPDNNAGLPLIYVIVATAVSVIAISFIAVVLKRRSK